MSGFNPVPKPKKKKQRNKVTPSIMQDTKECYVTGATHNLHRHEVYFGNPYRDLSLKWGCWLYLRADLHNQSNNGVHFNKELDNRLKRETQLKFEKLHGHEKFMEVFDRNYLKEREP
ncbi:MAG TPA: hypothetical protein VFC62_03520 [Atopostipes sp.]|nr:hypothetical protein [Atopostipes sp.]